MSRRGRRPERRAPSSLAEAKARYAAAAEAARRDRSDVLARTVAGGVALWKVGGVLVLMPAISPGAPLEAYAWATSRALAQAEGECPTCRAVVGITAVSRWGDTLADLRHEPGCPITDVPPELAGWFDPDGTRNLQAWASGL